MDLTKLPVAVIGAGPVGLAAAAHLVQRGETPVVIEAGPSVGASIRKWGHVRMFSPWRYNVDPVTSSMLSSAGWTAPDPDRLPTGQELTERYLEPLSELPQLAPHIRLGRRVLFVTRAGFDKLKTDGRAQAPFLLHVSNDEGAEEQLWVRAVIDASGTYECPNPLGASGTPAIGEPDLAGRIFYGMPDVLGAHRPRYAGQRVLVVGSGHSAFNVLLDMAELASRVPNTEITWAMRRSDPRRLFGGESPDQLPARGELGVRVRRLVDQGQVRLVADFKVARLESERDAIRVASQAATLLTVDEIIATTGFRPDFSMLRELRLALDPVVESPTALADLIDPNVHSCGTVPPHGARQLEHPEPNFYIVGMKSYGRAPTFLMLTGFEQVRSVVAAIVGDNQAANDVRLQLPETGVCSESLPTEEVGERDKLPVLVAGNSASCCAPACCGGSSRR